MAHGDARDGKWRGNWQMELVASTLHTTSEHGVSSITTADAHTPAASSRLNWRLRRFKWTGPFRRKTKSCFCACHHISIVVYAKWVALNMELTPTHNITSRPTRALASSYDNYPTITHFWTRDNSPPLPKKSYHALLLATLIVNLHVTD